MSSPIWCAHRDTNIGWEEILYILCIVVTHVVSSSLLLQLPDPLPPVGAPRPRPSVDTPTTRLKATVARSLLADLERRPLVASATASAGEKPGSNGEGDALVATGEPCKNGGCKQVRERRGHKLH